MPKFSTWPISTEIFAQHDNGSIGDGKTVIIDFSVAAKHKLLISGPAVIEFTGWPQSGNDAEMKIQIINGRSGAITWPKINWMLGNGASSTTFEDLGVTLQSSGSNFIWVWTSDHGATLYGAAA